MELESFGVNMPGCRYNVRPCEATDSGAERVLRSETGLLVTEKHELRNPFILTVNTEYVVIEAVN
jgi:hypothetical protein